MHADKETYKFQRMSTLAEKIKSARIHAKLPVSNEATFKKLVNDSGRLYLKPLNTGYPIEPLDEQCRIVGVVVRALQKF